MVHAWMMDGPDDVDRCLWSPQAINYESRFESETTKKTEKSHQIYNHNFDE